MSRVEVYTDGQDLSSVPWMQERGGRCVQVSDIKRRTLTVHHECTTLLDHVKQLRGPTWITIQPVHEVNPS